VSLLQAKNWTGIARKAKGTVFWRHLSRKESLGKISSRGGDSSPMVSNKRKAERTCTACEKSGGGSKTTVDSLLGKSVKRVVKNEDQTAAKKPSLKPSCTTKEWGYKKGRTKFGSKKFDLREK